jgi:hypothetical protein
MRPAELGPWKRHALAVMLSSCCTWSLQVMLDSLWPQELGTFTGLGIWYWAGLCLSACLGVLAVSPQVDARPRGVLLFLTAFAVLGVLGGNLLPAVAALLVEVRRIAPMLELEFLLAQLPRIQAPVALVLVALPAPLVIHALRARGAARLAALSGAALLLVALWGIITRAQLAWDARAALQHGAEVVLALRGPGGAWAAIFVALWAFTLGALLIGRAWLASCGCIGFALLLLDPLPAALGRLYPSMDEAGLPPASRAGQGSTIAALDLSRLPHSYAGETIEGGLAEALEAQGFVDQGPGFTVERFPPQIWDSRLQRAVQMIPALDATCGQLTGPLGTLRRYGTTIWLWPSRAAPVGGAALARAYARPVLQLLAYTPPPPGPPPRPEATAPVLCGELGQDPDGITLWAPGAGPRRFGVDAIEGVAAALGACDGYLVVAPAPELRIHQLHALLERLGGTHEDAAFRQRLALRWPGLDPDRPPSPPAVSVVPERGP